MGVVEEDEGKFKGPVEVAFFDVGEGRYDGDSFFPEVF